VVAAHVMAEELGLRSLLGPPCKDRDIGMVPTETYVKERGREQPARPEPAS
jgi:hypothetical protein